MIRVVYKKIAAAFALFTAELLLVWGVFLVSIIAFLYVSQAVLGGGPLEFDEAAFDYADDMKHPVLNTFIKGITFFASRQFLTPAALLLVGYFVFIRKHRWYSLKVPVVALGSITLNVILKYFFDRPRPLLPVVDASGLSFPSGHSMVAASFYGLLIYLVWHNVQPRGLRNFLVGFLIVFVLLIGFSRIYLRVHYATDVVAGFAAGFFWVIISISVLRRMERFSRKEIDPVVEEEPEEVNK
ncbi:phosphatase PAP2 family protein [Pontibacter ruber]|uniref:Phosphatase PAP2 family protein n=1 Tax=Pontibacter ruber TaxID=1343895 RepID=A0ABW5CV01_9BACT|nr:phosphatase PAP2 family protein [Pontibacter ruber]